MIRDHNSFSFAHSAEAHRRNLRTEVIEKALRAPITDEEHPYFEAEQDAVAALGLTPGLEFLVIVRARVLDDEPSAFHRAYLNPMRLPPDFLEHDFAVESLIDLYNQYGPKYGYAVEHRDTILTARGANLYETNTILTRYKKNPHGRVVLDAEQRLYARDAVKGDLFVLEFLKASYLDHWKYEIKNRPA
ncbi:MAG: UTRA domain-containing protein [Bryobacteraceae bacterium]|nr:UTRA domain-containing protein [Bryobacteraceae bacterium]